MDDATEAIAEVFFERTVKREMSVYASRTERAAMRAGLSDACIMLDLIRAHMGKCRRRGSKERPEETALREAADLIHSIRERIDVPSSYQTEQNDG